MLRMVVRSRSRGTFGQAITKKMEEAMTDWLTGWSCLSQSMRGGDE